MTPPWSEARTQIYRLPVNGIKSLCMAILSFNCAETQRLFCTGTTRRFANIQAVAERKLAQLDAAQTLDFLRSPPGNRLEMLTGNRKGQHSIRINDQWRLCFVWTDKGATNAEIVDYH